MKKLLISIISLLLSCSVSGEAFDIDACADFSVKIFRGNNHRSIMLVTASGYSHGGIGFEYAECQSGGSPAKNRFWTLLHLRMADGESKRLYYLTTIPQRAAKESDRFELAIGRPFFTGPEKRIPLHITRNGKATVTFTSFVNPDDQTEILRELKINLADNTAFFSCDPEKKFDVIWNTDGFTAEWLGGKRETFEFEWSSLEMFRRMDNGVTVIRRKTGYKWGIFPVYEKFHLTSVE